MTDRVEREVLQLVTESGQYFADLDKAIHKHTQLNAGIAQTGATAKVTSGEWKAFGQSVSTSSAGMQSAVKGATQQLGAFGQSFKQLTASFTAANLITRGIEWVLGFGSAALKSAGDMVDLADKTGLSIRAVQLYGAVAKQAGGDIQSFAKAQFNLGVNLSEGGTAARDAVRDLRLDFEKLRASSPDSQLESTAEALRKVGNEGDRNRLGVALYGNAWKEVSAGVVAGIGDIAKATSIASDEAVRAVDRYQDEVDQFFDNLEKRTVELTGKFLARARKTVGFTGMFGPLGFLAPEIAGALGVDLKLPETPASDKPKPPPPPGGIGDVSPELKKHLKEVRDLAESWSRLPVEREIKKWLEAAKEFDRLGLEPTTEQIAAMTLKVEEWIASGYKVPKMLQRVRDENIHLIYAMLPVKDMTNALTKDNGLLTKSVLAVGESYKVAAKKMDDARLNGMFRTTDWQTIFSGSMSGASLASQAKIPTIFDQLVGSVKSSLRVAAESFPDMLGRAILHGQSITQALRAVAVQFGADVGKTLGESFAKAGSQLSKLLGNIVSVGMSIGIDYLFKGVEKLIKHFSNSTKEAREAFAESMDLSLGELYQKLQSMGAAGQHLANIGLNVIGKQDKDANAKWMRDVQAFFDAIPKKFEALTTSLQTFGGVVPRSLRPMVEELLRAGNISGDLRRQLEALTAGPQWQTAVERAKELGIEVSSLGDSVNASRIKDIAFGYLHDLDMFDELKANMDGVLFGMSDELSALALDALKTGQALPKQLEPFLAKLREMGLLVDENGNAIGDLTFREMEDESLLAVKDVLEEIRDLLANALPQAAEKGAAGLGRAFARIKPPELLPGFGDDANVHGWGVDSGSFIPTLGRQPIEITNVVELDGEAITRYVSRALPERYEYLREAP